MVDRVFQQGDGTSSEERPSKTVRRYLQRRRTHGKRLFARVMDAILLLVLVFAAVWLYLHGKGVHVRHALLLAAIAALLAAVFCRMYTVWALQRFLPKETERIGKELLRKRMPFLEDATVRALCEIVSETQDPVVFRTAEAVSADALLPYLCGMKRDRSVFCAVAGFTKTAQALAEGQKHSVRLIGAEPLLQAAMRDERLRPSLREVYQEIERQETERKQRRKKARAFPVGGSGKRYILAAALLFLFSFRTGYALYYRMLASLCVSVAVLRMILANTMHTEHTT